MIQKKRIAIVDDHTLFRDGIKAVIERNPEYVVVAEAGNVRDGLKMVRALRPDILLVDISMPDKSGLHLIHEIRGLLPQLRVMVVSIHSKIDYIAEAFQAGATGYVIKESASEHLLHGIDVISRGEYYLDNSVSPQVIKKLMSHPVNTENITDPSYATLTRREQEVFRLKARGISNKAIAERLSITPKTVENHRTNLMHKLEMKGAVDLVRYAVKLGLVDMEE